jgi:hypothetical protein
MIYTKIPYTSHGNFLKKRNAPSVLPLESLMQSIAGSDELQSRKEKGCHEVQAWAWVGGSKACGSGETPDTLVCLPVTMHLS